MKTTDVCIFGMNFPPEPTGIAPYAGALAAGLAASGHDVTAHVAHPHYPEWKIYDGYGDWRHTEKFNGVRVLRLRHYVPKPPRGIRRLLSEMSLGIRLFFGRWGSPKAVIAISPPLFATALTVVRLRLTPWRPRFIVWVQDIYSLGIAETGEGGELVRRITRWVEKRTLSEADMVVVIHPRFADFVTRELGVAPSRVAVVRNWTHLPPSQEINQKVARDALGWPSEAFLAVHTGNMGVKQGLENVVDAARIADKHRLPVHFILVGEGGERRSLEDYAHGVSRLTFVDPLCDADYRLALGAADVLLVNEKAGVSTMAMPSKLTAYFDARRPVVAATDLQGITASEIRMADAGLIVPAGDPAELLRAVLAMKDDPEAAARYAANGRRHREFVLDERTAMQQWGALVDTVIARP